MHDIKLIFETQENCCTLFSLNFASTKFRDFREFEKMVKFNTRELKDTRKLKSRNLVLISAVVSGETKLPQMIRSAT